MGKSPFFMGKSTISMAIFNSFLLNYQRVNLYKSFMTVPSRPSSHPDCPSRRCIWLPNCWRSFESLSTSRSCWDVSIDWINVKKWILTIKHRNPTDKIGIKSGKLGISFTRKHVDLITVRVEKKTMSLPWTKRVYNMCVPFIHFLAGWCGATQVVSENDTGVTMKYGLIWQFATGKMMITMKFWMFYLVFTSPISNGISILANSFQLQRA